MDIVFNHSVALTAICNGSANRLRFGSQEKVANVEFANPHPNMSVDHRSHHDLVLSNGTVLRSVPVTAYRIESHFKSNATTSKTKTSTVSK